MDPHKNILNSSILNSTHQTPLSAHGSLATPSEQLNDNNILESFNNKKKVLIQALDAKRNVRF